MPRLYYIETYGCQMNVRDSETLAGVLEGLGYAPAGRPEDADVVVLNTCSVRERPHHKVYSRLGVLAKMKRRRPDMVIAVCGCMAQVAGDQIAAHSARRSQGPYVDIVLGPRNLAHFAEALAEVQARRRPTVLRDAAECLPEGLPAARAPGVAAYVNITYGCDNFCAYCIVPYARGREVSREPDDVLAEVREAVAAGYQEVTLLGQNVNSYGRGLDGPVSFADLLAQVDGVEGLRRLRFLTSHPRDCGEDLLRALADLPRLCEHLHLPLQAGDDDVLARMGRGYTYEHYRAIVARGRELVPGLAVTTDLMVGFPGETEEQFENTLRAVREIGFDQAFMFKYDDRPGTRAEALPDKLPEDVKLDRLARLIDLQNATARRINQAAVGREFEVLVDGLDEKHPGFVRGRTRQNKVVVLAGEPDLVGQMVVARATEGFLWGFRGERVR